MTSAWIPLYVQPSAKWFPVWPSCSVNELIFLLYAFSSLFPFKVLLTDIIIGRLNKNALFCLAPVLWVHNDILHFSGFFKFCLRRHLMCTKFHFPTSRIRWWSVICREKLKTWFLFKHIYCFSCVNYRSECSWFYKFEVVFNDAPVKQWQAVKIQLDLISEPPHTWVSSSKRATCHGHAPSALTLPLTIRLLITWDLVHAHPYRLVWGRKNRFPHDWKSLIKSKTGFLVDV